ncbi:hypothetical protein BH10BDE1_BH10BDE1_28020 [soil metagenome]
MSQEIERVKVERDNGHKERWAFGKWFYRKEAQKYSLATNRLGIVIALLFVTTSIVLMTRPPSQRFADGETMGLESEALLNASTQAIPANVSDGMTGSLSNRANRSPRIQAYKGAEHIERPRLLAIPPGTTAEAVLLTSASNGSARAKLTSDVEFNGESFIPKGSTLIGVGSSAEDRLKISFSKAVLPDGRIQDITAEAFDPSDQLVGLKGSRFWKYGAMVVAAGAASFAGGLADGLQETESNGLTVIRKSNLRNATLNGAGRAAIDTSTEFMSGWKDRRSVIQVESGKTFSISF